MGWSRLDKTTVGSDILDITTTQFTPKIFTQFIEHGLRLSATANGRWQFGDSGTIDTGTNYASRRSVDGGTEIAATSQTYIWHRADSDALSVGYMINIADEEKLVQGFEIHNASAGATNAPSRQEWTGKWVETVNQCDIVSSENGGSNEIASNSNLILIGTDGGESNTDIADGTIYEETDTNKRYIYSKTNEHWTEIIS